MKNHNYLSSYNKAVGQWPCRFFSSNQAQSSIAMVLRKRDINKARTCGRSPMPNLATVYSWLLDIWIPIPEEPYQPLKFITSQGINSVYCLIGSCSFQTSWFSNGKVFLQFSWTEDSYTCVHVQLPMGTYTQVSYGRTT